MKIITTNVKTWYKHMMYRKYIQFLAQSLTNINCLDFFSIDPSHSAPLLMIPLLWEFLSEDNFPMYILIYIFVS